MDVVVYSLLNKKIGTVSTEVEALQEGLHFQGSVTTIEDLPSTSTKGYAYSVGSLGMYAWDGSAWVSVSKQGPQGPQGNPGRDGAIQYTAGTGIEITENNVINNTQTSAEWGNIEGTLSNQTDLAGELDTLQLQITNLKNIGRFCAIWNANTGAPTTQPTTSPYTYKVGDYFRIGVTGYKVPTGSTYVPGAYDTVTEETGIGDVWHYDGTQWVKQASSGGGTVQDVQVNGTSILSGGIANIPIASASAAGAVILKASDGIWLDGNYLAINAATDAQVGAKTDTRRPIVPANLQLAVDTGVKGSSNYTSFACEMSDGTTKTLKLYSELI